jgi:predicted transcriptional regulator
VEYTQTELNEALQIVASAIGRCEKAQPKFAEGTSQHTLLKNRIKALYISKSLIAGENIINRYTKDELTEALRPVSSIISKCEKAQLKFAEGTSHHARFNKMIKAMNISKSLISDEIGKRDNPCLDCRINRVI